MGNLWQAICSKLIDRELFIDDKHPIAAAHHVNALALFRWLSGSDLTELPSFAEDLQHDYLAEHEDAFRQLIVEHVPHHALKALP